VKSRKAWDDIFQVLKQYNSIYINASCKAGRIIEREMNIFHDKPKFKEFTMTKLTLTKLLKGILHGE
jgi:hypothetical protein